MASYRHGATCLEYRPSTQPRLDGLPMTTDLTVVPATCPIRWSTKGHHGHSRTGRQACQTALQHVALVAETSLIGMRSMPAGWGSCLLVPRPGASGRKRRLAVAI